MRLFLGLLFVLLVGGCSGGSGTPVGDRFQVLDAVTLRAIRQENSKLVELTLPSGCVISVVSQEDHGSGVGAVASR